MEDKYIVRYWPDGIGSRSKIHEFTNKKAALEDAKILGLSGMFYVVYEAKVIRTNID